MGFWVFDWFDTKDITSDVALVDALGRRDVRRNFYDTAQSVAPAKPEPASSFTMLAGSGIDLTGANMCAAAGCLKKQVDDLMRHTWHYFDTVYVNDLTTRIASTAFNKVDWKYVTGWLQAVFYLRAIGAEHLVCFTSRNRPCDKHWRTVADELGLVTLSERFDELVSFFCSLAEIDVVEKSSAEVYAFLRFKNMWCGASYVRAKTYVASVSKTDLVKELVTQHLIGAIQSVESDLHTAVCAGAVLGSTAQINRILLEFNGNANMTQPAEVAFNIALPVLNDVPVTDLVRLREAEAESFEQFRLMLRRAIDERIKTDPTASSETIAREIEQDIIAPEVANLRVALSRNLSNLKANAVGVTLGAVTATVGALTSQTPLITSGLTACSVLGTAALATYRERLATQSSPMYFFFKAVDHAQKHADNPILMP